MDSPSSKRSFQQCYLMPLFTKEYNYLFYTTWFQYTDIYSKDWFHSAFLMLFWQIHLMFVLDFEYVLYRSIQWPSKDVFLFFQVLCLKFCHRPQIFSKFDSEMIWIRSFVFLQYFFRAEEGCFEYFRRTLKENFSSQVFSHFLSEFTSHFVPYL